MRQSDGMFDRHYQVIIADTPEARRIHHRIRYAVYCLETGYEDPADYPTGEERDAWDEQSVHFLVRHRKSGDWVAAMRLVVPSGIELPIHGISGVRVQPELSGHVAEVSRLCILGAHRSKQPAAMPLGQGALARTDGAWRSGWRRRGERAPLFRWRGADCDNGRAMPADPPAALAQATDRIGTSRGRPSPDSRGLILPGLLRAALEYSRDHDIGYWYFLISPALERMVRRMQVDLQRAGDACHHKGLRYPHLAELQELVFSAATRSEKMARFLSDGEPYQRCSELQARRPGFAGELKACHAA